MLRIVYNPLAAAAQVQRSFPFAVFGRTGGYGSTRSALVAAVNAGDHALAATLFHKLVLEGNEDAVQDGHCRTVAQAQDSLITFLLSEPGYLPFLLNVREDRIVG